MAKYLITSEQRKELKEMYNALSSETKNLANKIFGEGLEEIINNEKSEKLDLVINAIKTAVNNER